ncbi:MAG TPA: DNA ligase D [Burkholderiaceae bacterium]|nr:DNA ligase D [Burkholderiaceae bacterium]
MPRPARPAPTRDELKRYADKRNFAVTPEPRGVRAAPSKALSFVIQKHWATRLHYDLRLELDGVLLSWAVPKGPCFDPAEKRMAIHVEDHPVDYASFEGTIPPKQYGAGTVIVWDHGTWEPVGDAHAGLAEGKLVFTLHGEKLAGLWELVRIAKPSAPQGRSQGADSPSGGSARSAVGGQDRKQDAWMLFKKRDAWARPLAEYNVISALPDSVVDKPLGLVEEREPRGVPPQQPTILSPAGLPGAVKRALPGTLAPQLAVAAQAVPREGTWSYELKLDGYRLLARIDERGAVRLFTRNANDWTDRMPALAKSVAALGLKSTWLDGEIVVLDDKGTPDFNALQNAFDASHTGELSYFLFDLPFGDGYDLRQAPLKQRRALLRQIIDTHDGEHLRFSADFMADLPSLLDSVRQLGLEGVIAKRTDSAYVSRRAETWLKLKVSQRQEFVIGGFIDREASVAEVGSLLLGYYDGGVLQYAGNVGTGWDAETGARLRRQLARIELAQSPFEPGAVTPGRWTRRTPGGERWVEPQLIAEVSFSGWTPEGRVRHAVFQGLRSDKPARTVTRDVVVPAPSPPGNRIGTVKVSNPERVIDPSTGLKKLDLVRYYESVAQWMLPHLAGRPVSLLRGPTGLTGQLFFQKHDDALSIPGLRELDPAFWPGHPPMLELPDAAALISAAQMNVIEFHTGNSTTRAIDNPDRMVFDLDPGEGVAWSRVQEAALLVRTLLDELKLKAWLKTSGGKGLHVVVPLTPRLDYDTVKDLSQAMVLHLARTIPSRFVAKSGAANRVGKVFVDWLRNGRTATTVAAFSARARPGLSVSMPIAWDQLASLKSGAQWNIATAREYLSFQKSDPWADYWRCRQTLTAAMKVLGFKPQAVR